MDSFNFVWTIQACVGGSVLHPRFDSPDHTDAHSYDWKPLTLGCANHDWNDICPAGFVPTNCQAVKTAGGGATAVVYGYGDNYCTLRGCDFIFDAVTAHPSVTCSAR